MSNYRRVLQQKNKNMSEFMLFIKAKGNPVGNLSQDKQTEHIQKVGGFIQEIVIQGKMKNAQPLIPSGMIISNENGSFVKQPINEKEEMIVGFYHIQAENLEEAVKIAKSDPRFDDGKWRMEIREIMKVDGIN
jgi:hypothetical protein